MSSFLRPLHQDDIQSPINKPTDPCQIPGCQLKKHNIPLHHLHQQGQDSGTLSRWCIVHTIAKGFCHRCGTYEVWHKDTGLCRICEREMKVICDKEGVTVRAFVQEMIRRAKNDPSPFIINIEP